MSAEILNRFKTISLKINIALKPCLNSNNYCYIRDLAGGGG